VFDDAAARTAAIPSPTEGMVTYLKDVDRLEQFTTVFEPVSKPGILQVVSSVKSDVFTASVAAGANTPVTGYTVTITPKSASSKIMVFADVNTSGTVTENDTIFFFLTRDSTKIRLGDASSSRTRISIAVSGSQGQNGVITLLDSPNTTSAITYGVDIGHSSTTTRTVVFNRSFNDADSNATGRSASVFTVMEVAG
jgi:hypothetical protein